MNSKNDGYYPQIQPDNNNDGESATSVDQIRDFGSITAMNAENPIHCLTIIGQIEGHYILPQNSKATKYEHVIPALVAIEEEPAIKGLLVILNTVGGDVEAGLAIAELIAGMKKPVVSLVLGGGHSIGVPLSVAAKKSFIVPSATMTVHPVRMTGLVVGVPQTYNYFERMQDRIVKFICDNSKVNETDLRRMLHNTAELATDIGTVLSGEEAVKCGLIDEIGSLGDAIDCLNNMIEQQESEQNDGAAEE
ncbi:MAG: ClpP family protease [Acutalibacteraceae bacterium]